jgi:hypothetical protein
MEIALVEQGDVDIGAFQGSRRHQAGEASPQDKDPMWIAHGTFRLEILLAI